MRTGEVGKFGELAAKALAMEEVVAEDQRGLVAGEKVSTD